jgi:hypothetical protein
MKKRIIKHLIHNALFVAWMVTAFHYQHSTMISLFVTYVWIEALSQLMYCLWHDRPEFREISNKLRMLEPLNTYLRMAIEIPIIGYMAFQGYYWMTIFYAIAQSGIHHLHEKKYKNFLHS